MLCITNATIITPARSISRGTVLIRDDVIEAVGTVSELPPPPGATVLDVSGHLVTPGFIDLQFNGAFGHDFTRNPASIWPVAANLPFYGVTAFLPTIISSPLSTVKRAQEVILQGPPDNFGGAMPLGLHVEGPFLNRGRKGAHNADYLRPPALEDIENWWPERGIRMVTIAPELLGALDVIATLAERHIIVAAGHSMATYDEARWGIVAGIRYATHLFNAMAPIHHRKPGLIGALLADERITIGLVNDGQHLHPSLVKLIWQMTGDARLNLVTDAMAALGMPSGTYKLGDYRVMVDNRRATLTDGTLAGSTLSLDSALRNLLNYTGCAQTEAFRTITTTPATLLGISHRKGQIAPGFDADLVILTPQLTVLKTIIGGRIVFPKAVGA